MKSTQNLSTNTAVNFSRPKTSGLDFSKTTRAHSSFSKATHSRSTYTFISSLTVGSAAFLFGLTYGLFCPAVQPNSTSAVSGATADGSTISISAPSAINIDVTPEFDRPVFRTASATVTVSTTDLNGYSLSMGTSGTNSSGTATTDLIHTTKSSYTLPTLTSSTTLSTFSSTTDTTTLNRWGFTTDNNGTDTSLGQITANTYIPLTTSDSSTLIKKTDATATNDTTTVTFAAKVDSSLPSGDYVNTIIFSAVANPAPDDLVPTDDLLFWGQADNSTNTATTLVDKSGSGNNGTLYNFDNTTSSGYNDTDLVFDGVDDYVNLGLAGYDFNNSISYVAYVKMLATNTTYSQCIICNVESNGTEIYATKTIGYFAFAGYNGSAYIRPISTDAFNTSSYYAVIGTYDGSIIKLFVDGTLAASATTDTVTNCSEPMLLGANPANNGTANNEFANMALKEALIYDRALTESEVQTLTTGFQKKYQ